MEVFAGDHGLPNDVVLFSDTHHFPPFTLPTTTPTPTPTPTDTFSDHDHFPPPPQKLRPIRCHVRSSLSDRCTLADPVDDKTLLSWQPESGSVVPPNCDGLGLPVKEGLTEAALSSSSSDETCKLQEPIEEAVNKKKRKRKARRKMELFVESMMQQVIQKQEEMHKQVIEMLEQKEKESIMREQAWKKQETERAKRAEQARKQHVSHSLALISFIQKTLGKEIEIPDTLDIQGENHQSQEKSKYDAAGNDDTEMNSVEEFEGDPNHKRWPKAEVQALITVKVALNQKFNGKGPKGTIWEEVAAGLSGMGYNRSPKKCKEKWENINKYYRRTMEKGKDSKSCAYFSELEMLHKTGFISSNSQDEDQSIKVLP